MELQGNIASEFDQFSNNYTEDMTRCVPHYLKLISSLRDCLPNKFNARNILDLGCGNGNVSNKLISKFPNAKYTLIDASPEMTDICKQRFRSDNFNYITSYFQEWHFPTNEFNLVAAGFSLHHLDSQEKKWIFPLIYNSLKGGGIFSSSDLMINKNSKEHPTLLEEWKNFVNSNYSDELKWNWLMEHYDTFDHPDEFEDQKKWLLEAGFSRVEIGWCDRYWCNFLAYK